MTPIVLFVYNRPIHTKNLLDSLANNEEAQNSRLYIYCDGVKENSSLIEIEKIEKVREIVKIENRFEEVIIRFHQQNKGLAKSIIEGVSEVLESNSKVIVLEDDLIVSKFFLNYMNKALDLYEQNFEIGSIAGCNFFANGNEYPSSFFIPVTSSWGWATWKNRWEFFTNDNEFLFSEIKKKKLLLPFNVYGSFSYDKMMMNQINNKISSWAISWHAIHILNNWICLYPNLSLVNHIESVEATHANINIISSLSDTPILINDKSILINNKAFRALKIKINDKIETSILLTFNQILKKFIRKLLLIKNKVVLIIKKNNKKNISQKLLFVTMPTDSVLHAESNIVNMQMDSSKIQIGSNSHIRGHLQVFGQGGSISMGDFCYVGEYSKIWSAAKIEIGNHVLISHNVNIHDNISHPINAQKRIEDFERIIGFKQHDIMNFDLRAKNISIKDKAWIGFNSIILKGVTIGEGSIVGAGSVVTRDVPDWTIVAGNPAKIIREIPEDER